MCKGLEKSSKAGGGLEFLKTIMGVKRDRVQEV